MSDKMRRNIYIGFILCAALVFSATIGISIKNDAEQITLLKESIEARLLSISEAACDLISVDEFLSYNSIDDIRSNPDYSDQLGCLKTLALNTGAKYIYALKLIGGKAYVIFNTDPLNGSPFKEYELNAVYRQAFAGTPSVSFMNAEDGSDKLNTGAIPILMDKRIIGIICVDMDDTLITKSMSQYRFNIILTVSILAAVFILAGIALYRILSRIKKSHDELSQMAHYDKLTDLPNRRYLLNYLEKLTKKSREPFALFFVDVDNFKSVNNNAGHDAGDELLRHIALYLQNAYEGAATFRPGSGSLNVAARIGGDEFVLVMPGISTKEEAAAFAQNLIDGFKSSKVDKHIERYNVGLCVGAALYPSDSENYHVIIKYADIAMYKIKHNIINSFCIYTEGMDQEKDE